MVIAIDGPAGSGKSTIAALIAKKQNFTYINSGNLYRAITLGCIRAKIDFSGEAALGFTRNLNIDYDGEAVILNGENVTSLLHGDAVDAAVPALSSIVSIRHIVNDIVRKTASDLSGAVVEGRDMTTVVFPNAKHRFFLDATPESRAKRRFEQGVSGLSYEEILRGIKERDEVDRHKAEGSLIVGDGVTVIDTSLLTIEQTYEKIMNEVFPELRKG